MPFLMKQVQAKIDKRTTLVCLHAAGMIREIQEPFNTLNGDYDAPPFHRWCRSILRPYMRGFIDPQRKLANAELQNRPLDQRRFTGISNFDSPYPLPDEAGRVDVQNLLYQLRNGYTVDDVLSPATERISASGKKLIKRTVTSKAAENEVLANLVADAVGARTPITVRLTRNEIVYEFLPGKLGYRILRGQSVKPSDVIYAKTKSGKRLGLLDVLIGNTGRHSASWMLFDGNIVGFDHQFAFEWSKQAGKGRWGAFGIQWVVTPPGGQPHRYRGLLHPEDVPVLERRLKATRRAFQALGRDKDWQAMMLVFKELKRAANARKRVIRDD